MDKQDADGNGLLILIGRRDSNAMAVIGEMQIQNGGRLMQVYITDDSNLSADFIGEALEWNPPLASHTHHWYQIGPSIHTLTEEETLKICSNGIVICSKAGDQFQMLGEVMVDPHAESRHSLSPVSYEKRSFGIMAPFRALASVIIVGFMSFPLLLGMVLLEHDAEDRGTAWWRPLNHLMVYGGCLRLLLEAWCTGLGCMSGTARESVAAGVISTVLPCFAIFLAPGTFSTFSYCVVSTILLSGANVGTCVWQRGLRGAFYQLAWGIPWLCLTFGAWVVLYGIAVLHVQIDQVSKVASAFFLPLSTATLELGTIASATALYNHRVFKLRASDNPVWGDQAKSTLPVVPVAIHAFTETCRLVSVLASTVYDGSSYFWIFTGLLSLVLNVMNRQGWSRFLVTKTITRFGLRPQAVLGCTAPTAISRLHDVAKISCGYPRMSAPVVLGLVQLVTGHGFYRSTNTVIAVVVILVFEMREDCFHHWEVLPFAPLPMAAAEYFASLDKYSPYQSTVPATAITSSPTTVGGGPPSSIGMCDASPKSTTEVEVSPIASELSTGSHTPVRGRRVSISSAVSVGGVETGVSGKVRRWWGQDLKVHTALRLWHLRSWSWPVTLSMIWIMNVYTICCLELLLGLIVISCYEGTLNISTDGCSPRRCQPSQSITVRLGEDSVSASPLNIIASGGQEVRLCRNLNPIFRNTYIMYCNFGEVTVDTRECVTQWDPMGDPPWTPRSRQASAGLSDGAVLMLGGLGNEGPIQEVWQWTPSPTNILEGAWSRTEKLPPWNGRFDAAAIQQVTSESEQVVLMGGNDNQNRGDVWRWLRSPAIIELQLDESEETGSQARECVET
ncbi:unnamed protein product [Symbiodinium sp. KB8]|nr:unnamed protein product [Symbiodinium sp. KB8]